MSQNIRAVGSISPRQGSTWNVVGSGCASTSASDCRVSPSMADPSKPSPSANAPSTSAGAMATDFRVPTTPVNHSRTNLMPRSSIVRRTKSRCLSMGSSGECDPGGESRSLGYRTMPRLRLALGQTNPIVGDLAGNAAQILEAARRAHSQGADLLAVGECAISGYPIEDLASRPSFLASCADAVRQLAADLEAAGLGDLPVVVGHPDGPFEPRTLGTSNAPTAIAQNAASVLQHGAVRARYAKHHLPNYSVFDEYRVFLPGNDLLVVRLAGVDV